MYLADGSSYSGLERREGEGWNIERLIYECKTGLYYNSSRKSDQCKTKTNANGEDYFFYDKRGYYVGEWYIALFPLKNDVFFIKFLIREDSSEVPSTQEEVDYYMQTIESFRKI